MFGDNFSEQNKVFKEATLDIERNVFKTKDSLIQISNISRIWVGKMIGKSYPMGYFALLLVGLVFMISSKSTFSTLVGLCCIGIGGYLIYKIYEHNKENYYALHIEMNSGGRFILTSKNVDFLKKASAIITDTINKYGLESQGDHYHIDFSNHVIKNENGIVNTGYVGGGVSNEK